MAGLWQKKGEQGREGRNFEGNAPIAIVLEALRTRSYHRPYLILG